MTKITDRKNLAAVKLAMADKYDALSKCARSLVKQREFAHNAQRYRAQSVKLAGK